MMQPPKPIRVETWKIVTTFAVSLVGAAIAAWGIPVLEPIEEARAHAIIIGCMLVVAGILFGAATIRCPDCGSRLLLREAPNVVFGRFFSRFWLDMAALGRQVTCPRCHDDYLIQTDLNDMSDFPERHPVAICGRLIFGAFDLFLSTGFLILAAVLVKTAFREVSLMGAIIIYTIVFMIAIVVVYNLRKRA